MSNPLDEFLEEMGEKQAGIGEQFGNAAIGGFGAAAATAAIGGAAMGARALFNAATSARDFRKMLEQNDDVRQHHEANPRMVNQFYSSLRTMNPSFAKDPVVAGSYMRRMLENPMHAGGIAVETVGTRDKFPSLIDRTADESIGAARSHFGRKKPDGQ